MKKKILVISASPRKEGNSELLCDQFKIYWNGHLSHSGGSQLA